MWICKNCKEQSTDSFDNCWNCGSDTKGGKQSNFDKTKQSVSSGAEGNSNVQDVVVTDIKMSFSSMVVFMVKWVIASIPALIILFIIGFFVVSLFGVFSLAMFN